MVADSVVMYCCEHCDYQWMLDLEREEQAGTLSVAGQVQLANVRHRRSASW